ncbi:hypothetical protein QBC34DRAFT_298193, partial [Podospora aff. communis PSN243]
MTSVLRRQRPGWYAEDDGPTSLDRPIFVHEDVPFRPELAPICAFPSLPLTYDGLGPSEAFKQEEARAQEAAAAAAAAAAGQDDVVEGAAPDDKDAMSAGTEDAMSAGTDDGDIGHEEMSPTTRELKTTMKTLTTKTPLSKRTAVTGTSASRQRARTTAATSTTTATSRALDISTHHLIPSQNPFPDWPSLSNTMKYIIAYEFTQQGMSFVQAIRTLALSLEDSTELVNIVMAEHQKIGVIERDNDANLEFDLHLLGDYPNAYDNEWPQLITDYISPDEIASARAFLEFMGLNHIANRLDDYHGTGSGPYEVPLNHFDLEQALPLRLPTVPAQELLGRMDAPPGTVNPRHL